MDRWMDRWIDGYEAILRQEAGESCPLPCNLVPSHSDPELSLMTCFGQWDSNKLMEAEAWESACILEHLVRCTGKRNTWKSAVVPAEDILYQPVVS